MSSTLSAASDGTAHKENDAAGTSNAAVSTAVDISTAKSSSLSAPSDSATSPSASKRTASKPAKRQRKRKSKVSKDETWGSGSSSNNNNSGAGTGRPRRKSARARRSTVSSYNYEAYADQPTPSSSFYLGMVEDGETVEMIERKFARLAELEAKKKAQQKEAGEGDAANAGSTALTLEEQEQLFKETSTFTVSNTQKDPDDMSSLMMEEDYGWQMPSFDIDEDGDVENIREYMDLDDDFWEDMYEEKKASRKLARRSGKGKKSRGQGQGGRKRSAREPKPEPAKSYTCDRRGHFVTALKRVTQRDSNQIAYNRIPPRPLPLSWGRIIEPYTVPVDPATHKSSKFYQTTSDVLSLPVADIAAKSGGGEYQGILMSPEWVTDERLDPSLADEDHPNGKWVPNSREPGQITPEDLVRLNVDHKKAMPAGLVFIWVEKQHIARVIEAMEKVNFFYVENLCWVQQRSNNSIVGEDSEVLKKSKLTMLILRYGRLDKSGNYQSIKLEIRHQRTCDVVFDYLQIKDGKTRLPNWYIYNMIETLLPHSGFDTTKGRGKLLHLWSEPGVEREGWTHVLEQPLGE